MISDSIASIHIRDIFQLLAQQGHKDASLAPDSFVISRADR